MAEATGDDDTALQEPSLMPEDHAALAKLRDEYPSGYQIRYEDGLYQADIPFTSHVEADTVAELGRKIGQARARSLGIPRR